MGHTPSQSTFILFRYLSRQNNNPKWRRLNDRTWRPNYFCAKIKGTVHSLHQTTKSNILLTPCWSWSWSSCTNLSHQFWQDSSNPQSQTRKHMVAVIRYGRQRGHTAPATHSNREDLDPSLPEHLCRPPDTIGRPTTRNDDKDSGASRRSRPGIQISLGKAKRPPSVRSSSRKADLFYRI